MENTTKKKNAITFDINFNDLPSNPQNKLKRSHKLRKAQKTSKITPTAQIS